MGKSQRRKGQDGERELCNLLKKYLGVEVKRAVRQHASDADVQCLGPWALEIKRQKSADLNAWWEQTCRQAELVKKLPVLAYRLDYQPWRFVFAMRHVSDSYADQPIGMRCTMGIEEAALVIREAMHSVHVHVVEKCGEAVLVIQETLPIPRYSPSADPGLPPV